MRHPITCVATPTTMRPARGSWEPASVNSSRQPVKKIISKHLDWFAQELQRLVINPMIILVNFRSPALRT
jgi:hypothetical protein